MINQHAEIENGTYVSLSVISFANDRSPEPNQRINFRLHRRCMIPVDGRMLSSLNFSAWMESHRN